MPRFFIKRPYIKPRAQSQHILVAWYVILWCILWITMFHSCSIAFNCTAAQCSCSIRVHSSFTRVHSCSIRVHSCSLVFTRVHQCSLVFTSVHSCSDSCGVLDQIVVEWRFQSKHWSLILFQESIAINRLKPSLNHETKASKDLLIFNKSYLVTSLYI